jgi:SAM-dependent methyltransferase
VPCRVHFAQGTLWVAWASWSKRLSERGDSSVPSGLALGSLAAELAAFEQDLALAEDTALHDRARALDLASLIGELADHRRADPAAQALHQRAQVLARQLCATDERLFSRFRQQIRAGSLTGPALRRELDRYTSYRPEHTAAIHLGYDGLDLLLDGILGVDAPPTPTEALDPEMVHYEATPARVILDLLDHAGLGPDDVFYDLGAGLGGVAILVALLAKVRVVGIEVDPAYCALARDRAASLGVQDVELVCADARVADYSAGTVFYLFTPFRGAIFDAVLARLRQEADQRPITIGSYGTVTRHLFAQEWLRTDDPAMAHDFRLAVFRSSTGRSGAC